jgi:hypothetical protein
MLNLKKYWTERIVYSRSSGPYVIDMVDVPPIIPPALRGNEVLNTEYAKKSTFLSQKSCSFEGIIHIYTMRAQIYTMLEF